MPLILLLLALACPEVHSAKTSAPTAASVSLSDTTLTISVGKDTVGFGVSWSIVLSVDNGVGGMIPYNIACPTPGHSFFWWLAQSRYGIQWMWIPSTHINPDEGTIRCLWPVSSSVSAQAASTVLTVSCATIPIHIGDFYRLDIVTLEGPEEWPAWMLSGNIVGELPTGMPEAVVDLAALDE